jgi:hypothetical protein
LQTTYWAGGAWWGSYPMSVEPQNGVAAAQMAVLDRYTGAYPTVTSVKLSGSAPPNSTVYLSENGVLLATVKVPANGAGSGTLTGLANGVHTLILSTTWPTADGTIAAVTFNLAAPAAEKSEAFAAITPATVTAAADSTASPTFLAPTLSVTADQSTASVPATPQPAVNPWQELLAMHPTMADFLQELTRTGHAVTGAVGSIPFGSAAELASSVGIGSLLAHIVGQT